MRPVKLIPNLLSAARMALAPYLFLLLWRHQYDIALAVCFVAGFTDLLDGFIARHYKATSRLGAYLDPVADKVLLSGMFVTLAMDGAINKWLAMLVLGRDLFILLAVGGAFLFTAQRNFPPSIWGKASTAAQILFMFVFLLWICGWADARLLDLMKWITVALTAWSGIHYALRGVRYSGVFQHTSQ
jgi:cardiolipin synthase (CMP-forming)